MFLSFYLQAFFFEYSIGRILKYQSELTDKTDAFAQFVFERNRKINFLAKREDSIVKIGLLLNDFAVYMYNFATVLSLLNWLIVIFFWFTETMRTGDVDTDCSRTNHSRWSENWSSARQQRNRLYRKLCVDCRGVVKTVP